nr:DUF998 domain-containing protein [uncultured Rhodococcus sp.]
MTTPVPESTTRPPQLWARMGRWAGFFVVQFLVVEWVVSATWRGNYSYRWNYISELGTPFCGPSGYLPCSSMYVVANISIVLLGCSLAVAALSWFALGVLDIRSTSFFVVSAIGGVTAGGVSEATNYQIHSFGAAVLFVSANVALVFAAGGRLVPRPHRYAVTGFGAVGLLAYFLYMGGHQFGLGIGTLERVIAYSVISGMLILTSALFQATRVPRHRSARVADNEQSLGVSANGLSG